MSETAVVGTQTEVLHLERRHGVPRRPSRGARRDHRDPSGEVTALLGPNGAGKSSLVLAVGGVLRPDSGSIRLGDANLASRRPERIRQAGVAIVPEGRRLLSELTVQDNLNVATYSLSREDATEGTAYALRLFPELEKRIGRLGPLPLGW